MRHAIRPKRLLPAVIAALLLASAPALAQTTIVHWHHTSPAHDEMMRVLAQRFMEQNPDIRIELETFPLGEFLDKVLVNIAAGTGPDTVQVRSTWIPWLIDMGLQPLDPRVITADEITAEFVPGPLKHLQRDGVFYALPTGSQSVVLFYQPQLFELAGLDGNTPPATWEEVVEYARRIHRTDAQGATIQMGVATGGYAPVLATLMIQAGATLWDDEAGLPDFTTPEAARGMQFATDLVTVHGVEDPAFGSRWTAFRNERLGMVYAHPGMIGSFLATHPHLQFRITEVPPPEPGGSRSSLITTWAFAMTPKAESEAATKWIAFLESAESQRYRLQASGELPLRWEVIQDPENLADPLLNPVMWSLTRAVEVPWTADDIIDSHLGAAWRSIINRQLALPAAMERLQQQAVNSELAVGR